MNTVRMIGVAAPTSRDELDITVEWPEWRIFGFRIRRAKTITYRGSCTVWHRLDTGERASTPLESHLSDLWWSMEYSQIREVSP